MKKFKNYFCYYYEDKISNFMIRIQKVNKIDQVMQNNNIIVIILINF